MTSELIINPLRFIPVHTGNITNEELEQFNLRFIPVHTGNILL